MLAYPFANPVYASHEGDLVSDPSIALRNTYENHAVEPPHEPAPLVGCHDHVDPPELAAETTVSQNVLGQSPESIRIPDVPNRDEH
jgi:hypothetical protein